MSAQDQWRFCQNCMSMFYDGSPNKGRCQAGGGHLAQGLMFMLPNSVPETATSQTNWRFCQKCMSMFFDGSPNKGRCPVGGGHQAQGLMFVLPHDVPETATSQANWRFCQKCMCMFFDGSPNKGRCPAGGGHQAQGFMFVLPHGSGFVVADPQTFDSGPLVVSGPLPLSGSAHLVMRRNGDFTWSSHAHDAGLDNIDYVLSAVLRTPSGIAFTFQCAGHVEGTSAALPFGTPRRDDPRDFPGNNGMIIQEFDDLPGAVLVARIEGKDSLEAGLQGEINDLLKAVAAKFNEQAATLIVALVLA